tara:strand:+ start:655 stop:1416 length:762 start_codon:yes stop_codon:yes gene_type:complete
MKLIHKFKSPNYNKRKVSPIKYIIIHYTALKNCSDSISYLCDPNNKVSCHFLISQRGKIYSLVEEKYRAWHAGKSSWKNDKDINSLSIGIELDYSNAYQNNQYSFDMLMSLMVLIKYLIKKYKIKNYNVLGHSEIAPLRKIDPGPDFPWFKLDKKKITFNPDQIKISSSINLIHWFKKNNINSKKKIVLFILSYLGYNTYNLNNNNKLFKILLTCYQSRYLQSNISGKLDNLTFNFLLKHYFSFVLTKNKKKL